jgi:hypothetical protein
MLAATPFSLVSFPVLSPAQGFTLGGLMSYSRGSTNNSLFPSSSLPGSNILTTSNSEKDPDSSQIATTPVALIKKYQWLMVIFFVLHFSYLLYLQTRSDVVANAFLRVIGDLFILFGAAVCTAVCFYTARLLLKMRKTAPGVMVQRGWLALLCLGSAALLYSIGQLIWTWYEATVNLANFPFPAAYDPFYLAVYPFSWVGIALLIPRGGSVAGRTRLILDAAIAAASALAVSWYFLLGPTIASLSGSPLAKIVSIAYPLGDLSLCVAAALLIFGPSGTTALNSVIGRIGLGVTCLAVTDIIYGYFQLQGVYHTGFLQDVGWPMSWLFIGWGLLLYPQGLVRLSGQHLLNAQAAPTSPMGTASAALRAATPMLLAVLTCALLLLGVALHSTAFPLIQVAFVCVGLILLPVVRQVLTLIDNMLLNERLRIALDQSQQAFNQSQQELLSTSSRADQYEELRSGIETLQQVHARLARGDLKARAQVEGPLAPVAMSLNLMTERMEHWARFVQVNQVMEDEASRLSQVLSTLSEGHITSPFPNGRSGLPTSRALFIAMRLQSQLQLLFGRFREAMSQLDKRSKTTLETVRKAQKSLQGDQSQLAQETLRQVERSLISNQALLQDLQLQASIFVQHKDAGNLPVSQPDHR